MVLVLVTSYEIVGRRPRARPCCSSRTRRSGSSRTRGCTGVWWAVGLTIGGHRGDRCCGSGRHRRTWRPSPRQVDARRWCSRSCSGCGSRRSPSRARSVRPCSRSCAPRRTALAATPPRRRACSPSADDSRRRSTTPSRRGSRASSCSRRRRPPSSTRSRPSVRATRLAQHRGRRARQPRRGPRARRRLRPRRRSTTARSAQALRPARASGSRARPASRSTVADADATGDVPPEPQVVLLRAAQESLANVRRHAGARASRCTCCGSGVGRRARSPRGHRRRPRRSTRRRRTRRAVGLRGCAIAPTAGRPGRRRAGTGLPARAACRAAGRASDVGPGPGPASTRRRLRPDGTP